MKPLTATQQQQVADHMPLLKSIAQAAVKRSGGRMRFEDALSSASLGACQATSTFVPGRDCKLPTFIRYRANGQIIDDLRRDSGYVKDAQKFKPVTEKGDAVKLLARNDDGTLTLEARESFEKWVRIAADGCQETEFIFRCLYLEGMEVKETAQALGYNEFTVYNRLRAARTRVSQHGQKQ